jgi:hypothetical protein
MQTLIKDLSPFTVSSDENKEEIVISTEQLILLNEALLLMSNKDIAFKNRERLNQIRNLIEYCFLDAGIFCDCNNKRAEYILFCFDELTKQVGNNNLRAVGIYYK